MKRKSVILLLVSIFFLLTPQDRPAVANADRSRPVTVDRGAQDPAVSPDGAQIAVSVLGKIWVLPVAGGEAHQITEGFGWDTHPAWSPDGRFLAYAHQLPRGSEIIIYSMATGGSRSIYNNEAEIGQIAFSLAGGDIYFLLQRSQYDSHLHRLPVAGGEATQLTYTQNWHEWSFALSPDGKQVVLDSGRYGGSDLYRIQFDGMQTTRLTRTPQHEFSVAWSRDGSKLVYVETDNGKDTVIVQPASGGPARRVYSSPYDQKQLSLLPDGESAVLCAGRRLYRLNLASGAATAIAFTARFMLPQLPAADLVITNARLFDGTSDAVIDNATIEIRGGRIASVRRGQEAVGLPAGVPVIDAAGKTVMAGLMDNHYHYWSAFDGAELLARGVTTIRDPGVAISLGMNFKEAIAHGLLAGPDIYTCGPLIDGLGGYHPMVDVELSRPEAAAPLVRALKAQGVDALKVYFLLNPDVLRAVVKEAKAQGLPVTGHIGVRTGWREAMEAGINGFNHIRVWRDFLPLEKQPQGENESLDAGTNPIARMQADWGEIDPDGPRAEALIKMMIANRVGFDPTLALQNVGEFDRRRFSIEQYQTVRESYRRMSRFVARAQRMGVLLLAGTDNGSLFDELEAYAEAGVPSAAILRAATSNGAEWLGKQTEFGTVEPGKRANLIFVDGDPLKDIKDLRRVSLVIKEGRIVFKR